MEKKICSFADLVKRLREQDCFGLAAVLEDALEKLPEREDCFHFIDGFIRGLTAGVTISDAERETLWKELMEINEKGVATDCFCVGGQVNGCN